MASTSKQFETDDLEVTRVSRSGRVCKKSSRLIYSDFDSNIIKSKKKNKLPKHNQTSKQQSDLDDDNLQNKPQTSFDDNSSYKCIKRNMNLQQTVVEYEPDHKKKKSDSSSETSLTSNSETESGSTHTNNEIKTPDYTTYDEDSLNSDEELLFSKVTIPVSKPKKDISPKILFEKYIPVSNENATYTGYKLWSNEMKKEILKKYPNIDVTIMTIRLGEMWTKMSVTDRNNWHTRAQRLTEKVGCLQNRSVMDYKIKEWLNKCSANEVEECQLRQSYDQVKLRTIALQPIDIAAHLTLLGESLILIGDRLKYHDKPVLRSGCTTVLLDSLLCAMGSLMCLIQQIPLIQLDNSIPLRKTLENITYIMPGL